jgi:16S rRNA (cytidine1402-2'-O)-methyltransferase
LRDADIVAAEDTRRLRLLAAHLEVDVGGQVVSYHEHNEGRRTHELAGAVASGQTVVLVTDAGMPSVSDPGYRLVTACIEAGSAVTVLPGPSAAIAALAVSGLAVDRFCFEGFLPRKSGQRRERLRALAGETRTMVFFEAPHRTGDVLSDMAEIWGASRPGAVCRELTKTYEEVRRGSLHDLATWAGEGLRGEVTLVVSGASDVVDLSDDDLRERVHRLENSGLSRRDAVDAVTAETGIARRRVYAAANAPE